MDFGENAYDTAIREAKEETSVIIQKDDLQLIAAYHNLYTEVVSSVDLVFLVQHWEGEFTPQDDSAALEWKPLNFIYDPSFCETFYTGLDKKIIAALAK